MTIFTCLTLGFRPGIETDPIQKGVTVTGEGSHPINSLKNELQARGYNGRYSIKKLLHLHLRLTERLSLSWSPRLGFLGRWGNIEIPITDTLLVSFSTAITTSVIDATLAES